ncbi:hypothetical protein SAMN05216266_101786 [Amycolatopsis marina]|uniref:Uncharacterized protein n=1 Tax=Amycolatopsis marina TaxID=490629 RepID=A0A1I0W7J8_9PSEU|nr:hypothetical protein [Amycolatopsis marina]SFA84268.1 hypothetical protein SAMN05216266_101786 [Amycolatopsis marina]
MTEYTAVSSLTGLYLEDSFVLQLLEEPNTVKFRLEAVLTAAHPLYRDPKPGERYCYAEGWLVFAGASRIEWVRRSEQQYIDASGDGDLGNIDYLKQENDHWLVGGDWGEMRIFSQVVPELFLEQGGI